MLQNPESLDLSIIVLSFNTKEILLNCLRSVYEKTNGIEFEVIVVDNASADGSPEAVKKSFPQTVLAINEYNLGFSAGNNGGIKIARGRYVVLLNSDTLLTENCFKKIVRHLDDHPEFCICSPEVTDDAHKALPMRHFEDKPIDAIYRILGLYSFSRDAAKMTGDGPREVQTVGGQCFVVRRSLFEKIGLLDETYFLYNEEDDFCRLARKSGFKVCYYPETSLIHFFGKSTHLPKIREKVIIETYRSDLNFFAKHYSLFWNIALRCLYKITFILGAFKAIVKKIMSVSAEAPDSSVALKLKLFFLKTPRLQRK
jgi:GT2 family glycosyltransferase